MGIQQEGAASRAHLLSHLPATTLTAELNSQLVPLERERPRNSHYGFAQPTQFFGSKT